MRRITIVEEREYARRLTDYLNDHMEGQVRIDSYTSSDSFSDTVSEGRDVSDLYVMGERFYEELVVRGSAPPQEKILLIGEEKRRGMYYRWASPRQLLELIGESFHAMRSQEAHAEAMPLYPVVGVYAPSPSGHLREAVWKEMPEGGIYFGFEDIGQTAEPSFAMEKLCYYIRLHEEMVFEELKGIVSQKEGKYYLDSPAWFFDFLGLQEADFCWFFDRLQEKGLFSAIYVGFGNAVVTSMEFFRMFDQLLFYDHSRKVQIGAFCERLMHTLARENVMAESQVSWI